MQLIHREITSSARFIAIMPIRQLNKLLFGGFNEWKPASFLH
jgi:hypothetical protein